jgi:hypothetical protein
MHNYEEYLLLAMGNQQTITHYSQLTKERQEAGGRRQEERGFYLFFGADLKVQVLDLPPASCLRPPAFLLSSSSLYGFVY